MIAGGSLDRGLAHQYHLEAGGVTTHELDGDDDLAFWRLVGKLARMSANDRRDTGCRAVEEVVEAARVAEAPMIGDVLDLLLSLSGKLSNVTIVGDCLPRGDGDSIGDGPTATDVRDFFTDLVEVVSGTLKVMVEGEETAPAALGFAKVLGKMVTERGKSEDSEEHPSEDAAATADAIEKILFGGGGGGGGLGNNGNSRTDLLLRCIKDTAWTPGAPDRECEGMLGRHLLGKWASVLDRTGQGDELTSLPRDKERFTRFKEAVGNINRSTMRKLAFTRYLNNKSC